MHIYAQIIKLLVFIPHFGHWIIQLVHGLVSFSPKQPSSNPFTWHTLNMSIHIYTVYIYVNNPCFKSKVHVWRNQCVFTNLLMSCCIKNHLKARKAKQRRLRVNIFYIKCMFTYFPKQAAGSYFSLLFPFWMYSFKGVTEMHALIAISKI